HATHGGTDAFEHELTFALFEPLQAPDEHAETRRVHELEVFQIQDDPHVPLVDEVVERAAKLGSRSQIDFPTKCDGHPFAVATGCEFERHCLEATLPGNVPNEWGKLASG